MVGELLSVGMAATLLDTGAHCKGAPLIGGPRVSRVLVKACREAGVRVVDSVVVTDLLVDEGACHGAVGYHKRTGERFLLHAGSVVLATGGAGAVYALREVVFRERLLTQCILVLIFCVFAHGVWITLQWVLALQEAAWRGYLLMWAQAAVVAPYTAVLMPLARVPLGRFERWIISTPAERGRRRRW